MTIGFSDEGTISGIPTSVSDITDAIFTWDVDTVGGDIDMSAIAAISGVGDGARFTFINTGENAITFDDDIDGSGITYTFSGTGSILTLVYDLETETYRVI